LAEEWKPINPAKTKARKEALLPYPIGKFKSGYNFSWNGWHFP